MDNFQIRSRSIDGTRSQEWIKIIRLTTSQSEGDSTKEWASIMNPHFKRVLPRIVDDPTITMSISSPVAHHHNHLQLNHIKVEQTTLQIKHDTGRDSFNSSSSKIRYLMNRILTLARKPSFTHDPASNSLTATIPTTKVCLNLQLVRGRILMVITAAAATMTTNVPTNKRRASENCRGLMRTRIRLTLQTTANNRMM